MGRNKQCRCIVCLIVSIESLEAIMDETVLPGKTSLKYLPTYKLSQDCLELYFGALRKKFGNNNNPNVLQLQYALRRMLSVSISPSLNGNCISQDNTETARVSPLNMTSKDDKDTEETDEMLDLPSFSSMSIFISNVVTYISGFVGRNLVKKLHCEPCVSSLINYNVSQCMLRSDYILIEAKNNGGLFIPSEELISACRITEMVVREINNLSIKKLSKTILKTGIRKIIDAGIFNSLRQVNYLDHTTFGNHVLELIKLIVLEYTKVRLHHIAKEKTLTISRTCIRNQLTKSILFKGQ